MSEKIKIEEQLIDEKINELLNDPLIKTEEDKKFINDVASSLRKGEMPIDLISNKYNEAISKLNDIKNNHPEFESFTKHYQNKINEVMTQLTEQLKNQ